VLPIFEKKYPNDKRVRECIETLRRYAKGKATIKEVREARRSAADAAYAAAYAAAAAADAACETAARSSSLKRSADIVRQYYPKPPSIVKFLKRQEKGE
jgi:acyl-CoA reductase-like NAD-dependent aldehyde dehydrogenase